MTKQTAILILICLPVTTALYSESLPSKARYLERRAERSQESLESYVKALRLDHPEGRIWVRNLADEKSVSRQKDLIKIAAAKDTSGAPSSQAMEKSIAIELLGWVADQSSIDLLVANIDFRVDELHTFPAVKAFYRIGRQGVPALEEHLRQLASKIPDPGFPLDDGPLRTDVQTTIECIRAAHGNEEDFNAYLASLKHRGWSMKVQKWFFVFGAIS